MREWLKPHQFKSGNPGGPGRPKKLPLTDASREKLSSLVPEDPLGRTYAQLIVDKLCTMAVAGDIAAIKELADRSEGKAVQRIEQADATATPDVTYGLPDTEEHIQ